MTASTRQRNYVRKRSINYYCDRRYLWVLNRKLEGNILVSQTVVNASEGIQLSLNVDLILGVKIDLKGLGTVDLVADSLADDFSWVNDILKDLLVDVGQCA